MFARPNILNEVNAALAVLDSAISANGVLISTNTTAIGVNATAIGVNAAAILAKGYVDRGDTDSWDFSSGDFTQDDGWYDLDLSSIVPENVFAVHICMRIQHAVAGRQFFLRTKGNSEEKNMFRTTTQASGKIVDSDGWVFLGADSMLQYKAGAATWSMIALCVKGWLI